MRHAFLAAFCLWATTGTADSFTGKVTAVPAADLLTVDRGGAPYEVRLYGADAPEAGQPFADDALALVRSKALGQEVVVDGQATDTIGKIVGTVKLPDGTDLAASLISQGLAWWDEKNAPEAKALQGANAKALIGKSGLFKDAAALTPWDFRKSHGGEKYEYNRKPVEEKAEKAPVVLKLKGDMTEGKETADLGAGGTLPGGLALPPGVKIPQEAMGLVEKHKPRIAMDPSGKPMGLTADSISQIPFAGMFGFQDGDVFTGVNGMPIRSEVDVMGAVANLQGKKDFTISVNRGGKTIDVPIHVP